MLLALVESEPPDRNRSGPVWALFDRSLTFAGHRLRGLAMLSSRSRALMNDLELYLAELQIVSEAERNKHCSLYF